MLEGVDVLEGGDRGKRTSTPTLDPFDPFDSLDPLYWVFGLALNCSYNRVWRSSRSTG